MNNKNARARLARLAPLALSAGMIAASTAGAADTGTIDPAPIASAVVLTIGGVMTAGAAVMAASVGGRVAVKWVKRIVGMA